MPISSGSRPVTAESTKTLPADWPDGGLNKFYLGVRSTTPVEQDRLCKRLSAHRIVIQRETAPPPPPGTKTYFGACRTQEDISQMVQRLSRHLERHKPIISELRQKRGLFS